MQYIGIDVSKHWLDVAGVEGKARRLPNDSEGIAGLLEWVKQQSPQLVVLESTGAYHRQLLRALLAAGMRVALLNPTQLKAFRAVVLGRNKTDRQDARLLARFAKTYSDQLRAYVPPQQDQEQLRQVVKYREGLCKQRTQLLGQLEAATASGSQWLGRQLRQHLQQVERWIGQANEQIERLVQQMPEARVLLEVKGVGAVTASAVLAYLPRSIWANAKAAASYAGVHPAEHSSGQLHKSRLSRKGCSKLRRYLYMAALVAIRWDEQIKAYYDRLLGRGKSKKQALVAVMHKLLRHMMGKLNAFYAACLPQPA